MEGRQAVQQADLRKLMLLPARRMVLAIFLLMKVGRMSSFSLYPLRHRSSDIPAQFHHHFSVLDQEKV